MFRIVNKNLFHYIFLFFEEEFLGKEMAEQELVYFEKIIVASNHIGARDEARDLALALARACSLISARS